MGQLLRPKSNRTTNRTAGFSLQRHILFKRTAKSAKAAKFLIFP